MTRTIHPFVPLGVPTMPATTRAPMSRLPGAPAYYLGRPAAWWLTALHRPRPRLTRRAVG